MSNDSNPLFSVEQLLAVERLLDETLANLEEQDESPEMLQTRLHREFEEAGLPHFELPVEVAQFRISLGKESDRGCALLAAAYLDTEVGRMIKSFFVEDPGLIKDIFTGTGPLATFSSRINVAYLLGLIPRRAMRDLHLIRKIRNDFAHNPAELLFVNEPIKARCKELHYNVLGENLAPRAMFMRVALGVLAIIHAVLRSAKRPQIPSDIDLDNEEISIARKKLFRKGRS